MINTNWYEYTNEASLLQWGFLFIMPLRPLQLNICVNLRHLRETFYGICFKSASQYKIQVYEDFH